LGGSGGGIADAPIDGVQYGRQNAGWTPVTGGGSLPTGPIGYHLTGNGAGAPTYQGFLQAGSGATTRTWNDKAKERFSVKDFGAVGDGVADDTAAFQATIAALDAGSGGVLFIPRGTYNVGSTLAPTKPIRFVGEGWGYSASAYGSMAATIVTKIKWTGGHSAVFQFVNLFYGWGIERLELDCNGAAFVAVYIDSCCGGVFNEVNGHGFQEFGLYLIAMSNTTSWNHFSHTHWESNITGISCVQMDRVLGVGNVCINTFVSTSITHTGSRAGLIIGGSDNNSFIETYIYAPGGTTGPNVLIDPTVQAGFPVENIFFHLEASGPVGWTQPAGTTVPPATIVGLHQSVDPVLNGTPLVFQRNDGVWLTPNSQIDIVSAAATVTTANYTRAVRLTAAGAQQVNLQHVSGRYGASITIIDMGHAATGNKTIFANAPDTINGAASITLNQNWSAVVLSPNPDGSGWNVSPNYLAGLGTFAFQNYATPPAIGGTTPAAGSFTTLNATGLGVGGFAPSGAYPVGFNFNGATAHGPILTDASTLANVVFAYFTNNAGAAIIGSIAANGTANGVAYNTSSDIRGKPNRELLSLDLAREKIDALKIWDFDKPGNTIRGVGVIAQEAYVVDRDFATPGQTKDDWWMVEKAAPMPYVIANLQQLNARADAIEALLVKLQTKVHG
jgi:hypothetical protein